jgi:colanic acid/amylovoran biosynthesis glycosyltransferase
VSVWSLPSAPWVLHSNPVLGGVTDRWITTQARAADRYGARLLGADVAPGTDREPHWLVARDRPLLWLAYKGTWRSRGLSLACVAPAFGSNPPTLIHAHYGSIAAFHLRLARALSAGLTVSFYGFDATESRFTESRAWRRRYRRMFDQAGAVIAEAPKMASRIEALGCPAEKIHIVLLPADEHSLETLRADQRAPGFLVTLAGRFVEKKGFDFGIRAFARALRGVTDARLMLIGGGPLESELRRLAEEEGLGDQVIWRGQLAFESFMENVASADLMLFPSRTARNGDSEGGAPVTLIESQWVGVPAIVSSHDDLPSIASPEGSIVLAPDDLAGWAEALRSLYQHEERLASMGQAARVHARARHSIAANTRAREAVYDVVS